MSWPRIRVAAIVLPLDPFCAAADDSWFGQVPSPDRLRPNPYAGQSEASPDASTLFADHCAECHGPDALGRGKRPSLRSKAVQTATDGEIFWLLNNGNRRRGMPSWSSLHKPSGWQLIPYAKTLGERNPESIIPDAHEAQPQRK